MSYEFGSFECVWISRTREGVGQSETVEGEMVVVKTASNWQFYQQWISQVIRVDTPGATMSHLDQFEWQHLPRPIYPLDELAEWRAAP